MRITMDARTYETDAVSVTVAPPAEDTASAAAKLVKCHGTVHVYDIDQGLRTIAARCRCGLVSRSFAMMLSGDVPEVVPESGP